MGRHNVSINSRGQRNGAFTQSIVNHNVAVVDVDALGTVVAEVTEVQVAAGEVLK